MGTITLLLQNEELEFCLKLMGKTGGLYENNTIKH